MQAGAQPEIRYKNRTDPDVGEGAMCVVCERGAYTLFEREGSRCVVCEKNEPSGLVEAGKW